MINIFIPGVETTKKDVESTTSVLQDNGINNLCVFDAQNHVHGRSAVVIPFNIFNRLFNIIQDDSANLICLNEGCNYGIIALSSFIEKKELIDGQINKLVLISPRIWDATLEEKKKIDRINEYFDYYSENHSKDQRILRKLINMLSMESIIIQRKIRESQTMAQWLFMENYVDNNVLIVRSLGDRETSQKGIQKLQKGGLNTSEIDVETTMANSLLSKEGPVLAKKISNFINF